MASDPLYRPCVGVVLMNRDGLVWAGERFNAPDAWQMPQGGIEKGESPNVAALRELTEETSVPASAVEVIAETPDWLRYDLPEEIRSKIWSGKFLGQEQKWFLMRFTGDDAMIDIDTDEPEFGRWNWMAMPDIIAAIVPFKRDVYERVATHFSDYLEA